MNDNNFTPPAQGPAPGFTPPAPNPSAPGFNPSPSGTSVFDNPALAAPSKITSGPSKKSPKPLFAAILAVVLLAAGAFAVYFLAPDLWHKIFKGSKTAPSDPEPVVVAEEDLSDADIKSALFDKLFYLHKSTVTKTEASPPDNFKDGAYFEFSDSGDGVTENLYPNLSSLSIADRLQIVTNYIKSSEPELLTTLSSFENVPDGYYSTLNPERCQNLTDQDEFYNAVCSDNSVVVAISGENVASVYRKFFGVAPEPQNPTPRCDGFMHDSTYNIYVDIMSLNCGGVAELVHQLYVSRCTYSTKSDNKYYVYASLNTIDTQASADNIYKAFLKNSAFYDSETQTKLTIDPALVYKTASASEYANNMLITPENYTEFEQYRFVFLLSPEGSYVLNSVEKL